jgi:hypothetical protein
VTQRRKSNTQFGKTGTLVVWSTLAAGLLLAAGTFFAFSGGNDPANHMANNNLPAAGPRIVDVEPVAPRPEIAQPTQPAPESQVAETAPSHPAPRPMSLDERLVAQLEAGEFAPAVRTAQGVESIALRDRYLAQIAGAQAAAGLYDGAVDTIGLMSGDVARTNALASVGGLPIGAAGGGPNIDYTQILELVTNTVARDTWDTVGGPGSIRPFPQGVWVDAQGLLNRELTQDTEQWLEPLRTSEAFAGRGFSEDVRRASGLRKVSLPRLERAMQLAAARGEAASEDMLTLAGIQRIEYIFVYPETGDLVIAGPAGDWKTDTAGRTVSTENGRPTLRLDDLVVLLRHAEKNPGAPFGCTIDPRQDNLAEAQRYIDQNRNRSLRPGRETEQWVEGIRARVGRQDIDLLGHIDPTSNVARVLVEADYHMKLVGIGLADGLNVPSYLDMLPAGEAAPALGLVRWWFTLNYNALEANEGLTAFHVRGQAAQVQSEDVFLAEHGQKVYSGQSNPMNQAFAHNFTAHFNELAAHYPIYSELQGVFDLSLVAALVKTGGLAEKAGWSMTYFGPEGDFDTEVLPVPQEIESVVNHKVVNGKQIVAQVSGGVSADPWKFVSRDAIEPAGDGALASYRDRSEPVGQPVGHWWWD